jgi:serine/threonine protein kinase/tetratricopeptide (TPR) repeat protein
MEILAEPVAICSTCREPMNARDACLVCLLRGGLEGRGEDELPPESLVFGDFEIAQREDGSFWELGCGAMGVTYRATDKVLHRPVALKVIETPSAAGDSRAVRERFLREARAAAALRHPNVAGVFQFGAAPEIDRCYYAMELVEGETLETRVRRDGPLKAELALEISIQVARALTGAAAQGLIHRDLKPSNIMLTHADGGTAQFQVKVIDFGLAKATNGVAETDLTHGGFVGTPSFASPEQFDNATADARSDIYSLGATLWYALTGQVPYPGKTIEEIRDRQQRIDLPVERLAERKIPDPLIEILRRALALDPTQRPASARELLEALESCRAQLVPPNEFAPRRTIRKIAALVVLFVVAPAILFAFVLLRQKANHPTPLAEKSIAVLPFENLSQEQENAFFAGGMQDELLSDLARIADLKVISRTSVMQYQDGRERNLREIGRTLGVANVVEGSVQRSGRHVRVVAQLIDARTDAHLWGETYDRDLSDMFAIQTEIAEQIARQLQAKISPQEKAVIAERPTSDLTAYAFYDEAMTQKNTDEGGYEKRVKLLREAIRRDPNFILAYCLLAKLYSDHYMAQNFASQTDRRATAALEKEVIDTALRLRPDRGEPYLAAAYHSFHTHEYTEARREIEIALRLLPNDAQATFLDARLDRHENRWDDALVKARRAGVLDPHNEFFVLWTSEAYLLIRRYDEGEEFVRQARSRNPGSAAIFDGVLARFKVAEGDLTGARALATSPTDDRALEAQFDAVFYSRDYDGALKVVAAAPPDLVESQFGDRSPNSFAEAEVYRALGDEQKAEQAFLILRRGMGPNANPQSRNEWYYLYAGKFDAGLHRKDEAIREARQAMDLNPIAQDPISGPVMAEGLALVYAWTGERDLAIEQLAILAGLPSDISYGDLRFNPDWDSLRGDPRFETIVASLKPGAIASTQ